MNPTPTTSILTGAIAAKRAIAAEPTGEPGASHPGRQGGRRHRNIAAALVALIAAILAFTSAASNAAPGNNASNAQGDNCPAMELISIPGTNETTTNANPMQPVGMLGPITDKLKSQYGSRIQAFTLPYTARAFTDGALYLDSKNTGLQALRTELTRLADTCPLTKVGIAGYSQGADIAGDIACEIGANTTFPAANTVGVALLSDPHRGTQGETTIGPQAPGQGIMGPRDCTFGALSDRVASICASGASPDLYCATDESKDPFLKGIAQTLGTASTTNSATNTSTNTSPQLKVSDLASDFSQADIANLPTTIATLIDQARSGDASSVARTASELANTLTPLASFVSDAASNPGIESALRNAPVDTPQATTSQFIDTLKTLDLDKALNSALTLSQSALALTGNGARAPTTNNSTATSLDSSATALGNQLAPITSAPADQLTNATSVLSIIKPQVFIDQALNVVNGTISMAGNFPEILDTLNRIVAIFTDPNPDLWAKVDTFHQLTDKLTDLFDPLIIMASKVDLKTAAQLVRMIPDPSGTAQAVSIALDIASGVDIIRVAKRIKELQATAWKFIDSCKTVCNPLVATELIPIGLDFATITVNALTGGGTKTSTTELSTTNRSAPKTNQSSTQPSTGNLDSTLKSLTSLVSSDKAANLSALVSQGVDAATFFASGTHTNYANYTVDQSGRNSVQWIADWFITQFDKAIRT